jgi:hypothetical protein
MWRCCKGDTLTSGSLALFVHLHSTSPRISVVVKDGRKINANRIQKKDNGYRKTEEEGTDEQKEGGKE